MDGLADCTETDRQLLRRYADGAETRAFEALVNRHARLVYSATVRRVGNRHLAEDVAQAVFFILARKARSASKEATVSRWLLLTTRQVAANALRSEARRKRREAAVAQREQAACAGASADPSEVLVWQEACTYLDDAVLKLPHLDRHVMLLRYFEEKPIGEIAQKLRLSEGAVKQRLARALTKLRRRLARMELVAGSVSGEQFVNLLQRHAVKSAPPGLADAAASGALHGTGSIQMLSLSKGALNMMKWMKIKLAAAVAGAVIVGGSGGAWELHRAFADGPPQSQQTQQQAQTPPVDPNVVAALNEAQPVVVSTFPQAGVADVDPSITQIRVTYSKPMRDGCWAFCQDSDDTYPGIHGAAGNPHYEADHLTCVLPVKLKPGHAYKLLLNTEAYMSFQDVHQRPALPYVLVFGTRR